MEKFEKKKQIDCKVILYTSPRQMSRDVKCVLSNLVSEKTSGSTDDVEAIIDPEEHVYVICAFNSYGDVCGFASVEDDYDCIYLRELFVTSTERKNGYGSKLLQAVQRYANKLKKDYVNLIVTGGNANAQRLYRNNGFSYLSSTPHGDFCMQRPALESVAYQGKLLTEIAAKHGVEHMVDSFSEALEKESLLLYIDDFNAKNKDDMIDLKRMKDACAFLEEFVANGRNKDHLKAFINQKLNQFSEEDKKNYPKTMAIGNAEQITAVVKYAEEYLIIEKSELIKTEGLKTYENKKKR